MPRLKRVFSIGDSVSIKSQNQRTYRTYSLMSESVGVIEDITPYMIRVNFEGGVVVNCKRLHLELISKIEPSPIIETEKSTTFKLDFLLKEEPINKNSLIDILNESESLIQKQSDLLSGLSKIENLLKTGYKFSLSKNLDLMVKGGKIHLIQEPPESHFKNEVVLTINEFKKICQSFGFTL